MTWVKIDDGFPRHPKVLKLPVSAKWAFVEALCYCGEFNTDGQFPSSLMADKDLRLLIAGDLVYPVEGVLWIHDYLDYNPSRESVENDRRKARERRARGGKRSGDVRANDEEQSGDVHEPRPDPTRPESPTSPDPEDLKEPPHAAAVDYFDEPKWRHLIATLHRKGWADSGKGAVTWGWVMKLRIRYGSRIVDSALSEATLDEHAPAVSGAAYLESICVRKQAEAA